VFHWDILTVTGPVPLQKYLIALILIL
jgi:hypothetical protein